MSNLLKVGDMVILGYKSDRSYTGIIKRIETDRWGHQENVFIHWQGVQPHVYTDKYGFSGFNICNLRHDFKVIRQ